MSNLNALNVECILKSNKIEPIEGGNQFNQVAPMNLPLLSSMPLSHNYCRLCVFSVDFIDYKDFYLNLHSILRLLPQR